MKTEQVRLDGLLLGGVGFYGDPFRTKGGWDADNEIGRTWWRYMDYQSRNASRGYSCCKPVCYEVHIYGPETEEKGFFEVFVGEEVHSSQLPAEFCSKYIPSGDYLKVTLTGTEITGDWWNALDTELLPSLGLSKNGSFIIQAYDERFKGTSQMEESQLEVYLPVKSQDNR